MKATYLPPVKSLKTSQFWLLTIAASLVSIYLTLQSRTDLNSLSMGVVFWAAVAGLVWRKRDSLNLESDFFSSCLGALLIAWILFKGLSLQPSDPFLYFLPLINALALCLLASGIRGIWQYWQELLCLCFISVPTMNVGRLFEPALPLLTAKFAAFTLWYLGFNTLRQGTQIVLPAGSIDVNLACAGLSSLIHLSGLAVAFLLLFPLTGWFNKIIVPLVAVALAFVTNGLRVALMGVIVASGDKEAFEYWHSGDGSFLFSLFAVMLLGTFCLFLIQREAE
jgi:cyanoexosortase A